MVGEALQYLTRLKVLAHMAQLVLDALVLECVCHALDALQRVVLPVRQCNHYTDESRRNRLTGHLLGELDHEALACTAEGFQQKPVAHVNVLQMHFTFEKPTDH